jgi:gluconate 2-dehydrogenase gamma chain
MTEFTRRALLQVGGAVGVSAALVSLPVAQQGDGRSAFQFFTPEEAAFIEAAVDRLIPPEPEWPGAREAGVPNYIDLQLAGPFGQGDRLYLAGPIKPGTPSQGYQLGLTPAQVYKTSLGAILRRSQEAGSSFVQASHEEQDNFLQRLEAGQLDLDGVPSAIFFETLFANTIEGFFSDPAYGGNRDKVGWRMVGFPGVYAAYLGVYTQHGLRYEREPLSMADAHRVYGHNTAPTHGGAPASLHRHR